MAKLKLLPYSEFNPQPIRHRILRGWLAEMMKPGGSRHVVDWSCGSGIGTEHLREEQPSWKFTMVDVADIRKTAKDADFHLLDYDTPKLDIPDGSVDAVISSEVFEHVHNLTATVREMHRILKPGGFLVGSIPNFRGWASRFSFLRRGLYRMGGKFENGGHVNLITPEFLVNFLGEIFVLRRSAGDVDWITWVDYVPERFTRRAYQTLKFRGLFRETLGFNRFSYDFLFIFIKK